MAKRLSHSHKFTINPRIRNDGGATVYVGLCKIVIQRRPSGIVWNQDWRTTPGRQQTLTGANIYRFGLGPGETFIAPEGEPLPKDVLLMKISAEPGETRGQIKARAADWIKANHPVEYYGGKREAIDAILRTELHPECRTATVFGVAQHMIETGNYYSVSPILADAMMDAGASEEIVARIIRVCNG